MKIGSRSCILVVTVMISWFFAACVTQEPSNSVNAESTPAFDSTAQVSEYIVNIFEDKPGNLWFGRMSDGTVCYDNTVGGDL